MDKSKFITPLAHVCSVFSTDEDRIKKHSKEWEKITCKHPTPWPAQGTWDKDILNKMEGIIEAKYKGKKKDKRKATLKYFKLFKEREEEGDLRGPRRNPFTTPTYKERNSPSAPPHHPTTLDPMGEPFILS